MEKISILVILFLSNLFTEQDNAASSKKQFSELENGKHKIENSVFYVIEDCFDSNREVSIYSESKHKIQLSYYYTLNSSFPQTNKKSQEDLTFVKVNIDQK